MREAHPEFGMPELGRRLSVKKVDCAARGGLNLGTCYLVSGIGIAAQKNMDLLHCLAGILKRLSGPFVIGVTSIGPQRNWKPPDGSKSSEPRSTGPPCPPAVNDALTSSLCPTA